MNSDDLIALNEEIAGMARAGLPLDQGLAALAKEMGRGRLRRVTIALAEDMRAGHTLPEALQRQAGHVPPYYASLLTAGIRSGGIGSVLATLTGYARTMANLRAIVTEALFYPAVVLGFAALLIGMLAFYILPQFGVIFQDFNMRLPALTDFVVSLGRHPWEYVILPILVTVGGFVVLRFVLRLSQRGRRVWARLVYGVPVLGTLIRSARLAAFTDLLAILVDHELPLPEAFRLAGQASADPIMAAQSRQIHDDLSEGRPLGEVLKSRSLVPEWVAWLTGLGERRGALGQSLHQVAGIYGRQVEVRASLLRSVLPPFVIICTAGLFVGLFVIVLFLPMSKLLEGLSK